MDALEKSIEVSLLFDVYQDLLTEKQKTYIKDYYFDDLSLQEMHENYQVSRNAIHDQLRKAVEKLFYYEKTLHMVQKEKQLHRLFMNIEQETDIKAIKKHIESYKKAE